MPSLDDRTLAERSGRDSAQRPRPGFRVSPRLEALETRCLMSGWRPRSEYSHVLSLPIRAAAVTTNPLVHHDLDRDSVRQDVTRESSHNRLSPNDGDRGRAYDAGGSMSNDTPWSGLASLASLPRARYVVVPETKSPHQTLATAQELPDLPYFGVVGTLGPGDPVDLYRLTLATEAQSLGFGLVADPSAATVPLRLQLFDGSGQVLGEWSLGGQGTSSLHGELASLPAGSTVYFGVTGGDPSGSGGLSGSIGYQLWVIHSPATDLAAASAVSAGGAVAGSASLPVLGSPLTDLTGLGAIPSRGDSQAAPSPAPNGSSGGLPVPVAVGAPAMRSARPSGGLLSDDDLAPPAANDSRAAVNKEWDERSLTGLALREAEGVEPTAVSGRDQESEALVVIHSPGGFPLFGAVAIGHRRRNPAAAVGDFATPAALGNRTLPVDPQPEAEGLVANSEPLRTEEGGSAPSQPLRARHWGAFPISVFSGLGVATVFTLNTVLSGPLAGFDYLTSRLDAGGRPRSSRRERLRKTGGGG